MRRSRVSNAVFAGLVVLAILTVAGAGDFRLFHYSSRYARASTDAALISEQIRILAVVAADAAVPGADLATIKETGTQAGLRVASVLETFRRSGLERDEVQPLQSRLQAYFAALALADKLFAGGDAVHARQVAVGTQPLIPPITALTHKITADMQRAAARTSRVAEIGSVTLMVVAIVTIAGLLVAVESRRRRGAVRMANEAGRGESAEKLAVMNRVLRTVSAADSAVVHAADESALLDDMCRVIVETGGYPRAWIAAPRPGKPGQVVPVANFGDGGSFHREAASSGVPITGPVGDAVQLGKTVVVADLTTLPDDLVVRRIALEHGYRSVLAVPILVGAEVFGAIVIYGDAPGAFDAGAVAVLEDLAKNLGFGIEALRTRAERQTYLRRLEQRFGGMIDVVASTVEMRDPYTAGHQRGVAELAAAVAVEMGLDKDTVEGIEVAAGIHDIGKVAIPAEILSKPKRLTPAEFELIKEHPQAGYDIVKTIEFPWPVADMILQHHERLDGSGYPFGLRGDEILLGARVIAVADTVEAMAAHRPYRPSRGIAAALRQIEEDRGVRLDAHAVDACLRLFATRRFSLDGADQGVAVSV